MLTSSLNIGIWQAALKASLLSTVPSGQAGSPIGLLLALTKAS